MTYPRYAVNHYLCPPDVSLATFVGTVADAGFDGIGLTEAALQQMPLPDLRAMLAERQLAISSVNTAGFFLSDDPQQAQRNTWLLNATAELDAPVLNIIVGASEPAVPLETARTRAEEWLASFAERAQTAGVQLIVEPMWLANTFTKSCFQSISQIDDVLSRIPGLKLNLDYYHLWSDPDLGRVLRGQGCPVGLLQICDITWDTAPNHAVRAPLGEGRLSILEQLTALGHAPGDYSIELELFIDQLPGRNYADLIRDAARQLLL